MPSACILPVPVIPNLQSSHSIRPVRGDRGAPDSRCRLLRAVVECDFVVAQDLGKLRVVHQSSHVPHPESGRRPVEDGDARVSGEPRSVHESVGVRDIPVCRTGQCLARSVVGIMGDRRRCSDAHRSIVAQIDQSGRFDRTKRYHGNLLGVLHCNGPLRSSREAIAGEAFPDSAVHALGGVEYAVLLEWVAESASCRDRPEWLASVSAINQSICFVEPDLANAFPDAFRRISPTHPKSPCRWPLAASVTRSRSPLASRFSGSSPSREVRGVVSHNHEL